MESNRQFFDQSLLEKLRQISQQFEQYKMNAKLHEDLAKMKETELQKEIRDWQLKLFQSEERANKLQQKVDVYGDEYKDRARTYADRIVYLSKLNDEKEAEVSRLKLELCDLNGKIARFEETEVDKVVEENRKLKSYADELERTCDNWQGTFNQMFDQNKSLREQLQEYREQAQLTEVGRLTRMFENIDFGIKQTFFQIRDTQKSMQELTGLVQQNQLQNANGEECRCDKQTRIDQLEELYSATAKGLAHFEERYSEKCAEVENLSESHQQRVQIMNKFVTDLLEKYARSTKPEDSQQQNVVSASAEDDDKESVFCMDYMDGYRKDLTESFDEVGRESSSEDNSSFMTLHDEEQLSDEDADSASDPESEDDDNASSISTLSDWIRNRASDRVYAPVYGFRSHRPNPQ